MKVALAVIGRMENRYAEEFIQYYKKLGIDHIFIGDNNDINGEHFEDVLQSYINDNFVTIIDLRSKSNIQLPFMDNIYHTYYHKYDWFVFFDFDEFLTLEKDNNIKDYLSRKCFNDYNQILINWKIYTDNNLIEDDGRPCLERFTEPMETYKSVFYNFPQNNHVKCIIRGNLKDVNVGSPHCINGSLIDNTTCTSIGIKTNISPFQDINYELAYIKHFYTKTIDEYINQKRYRGGIGYCGINNMNDILTFDIFFKINNVTPEKLKYIKNHGFNYEINK